MLPSKDEGLLLLHPYIVPFLIGSSNKAPAFGKVEVHTEVYWGDPFPKNQHVLLSLEAISGASSTTAKDTC